MGNINKEQRETAVANLKEFHNERLSKYPGDRIYFFPKIPYLTTNQTRVVGLFRSELERSDGDVYVELVDNNYSPIDEKRTLYKHRYNPNYKFEYEKAPGQFSERFSVPVSKLEIVWSITNSYVEKMDFENMEDNNISQLTIRDLAAILLKKPVSGKAWLNRLVQG
jgi:hypothetical protein